MMASLLQVHSEFHLYSAWVITTKFGDLMRKFQKNEDLW
jgi:hypothetical protein